MSVADCGDWVSVPEDGNLQTFRSKKERFKGDPILKPAAIVFSALSAFRPSPESRPSSCVHLPGFVSRVPPSRRPYRKAHLRSAESVETALFYPCFQSSNQVFQFRHPRAAPKILGFGDDAEIPDRCVTTPRKGNDVVDVVNVRIGPNAFEVTGDHGPFYISGNSAISVWSTDEYETGRNSKQCSEYCRIPHRIARPLSDAIPPHRTGKLNRCAVA